MSRTLLYTVQRVLEKLDLDVINSINDSQDAVLVAREAEDTFFDLVSRNEWPERYDIIELENVGDTNNPTALRLPSEVLRIDSLRYDITKTGDTDKVYKDLKQLDAEEFLDIVYNRSSSSSDITEVSYKGVSMFILNDAEPTYYTTFDNKLIVMDAWLSSEETTVNGSKSVCRGSFIPSWEHDDDFVIPLDNNTYPLYLAELAAACSMYLNGVQSFEDERRRARGISRLRRKAFRTDKQIKQNKYGRDGNGVS